MQSTQIFQVSFSANQFLNSQPPRFPIIIGTTKKENQLRYKGSKGKKKILCIIRESNTGLVDGNDEFYH